MGSLPISRYFVVEMEFWDRLSELESLYRFWKATTKGKFNFIVISGRRGVGKTRLIFEFASRYDVKNMVYLFVEKKEMPSLITGFIKRLERVVGRKLPKVSTIEDFLLLLLELSRETPILVVFDEFQNFNFVDKSSFYKFQEVIDRAKFQGNVKLMIIVIGSLIGMMRNIMENEQAPLYGRKTGEIWVKPFEFWQIRSMLKKFGVKDEREIVEIYSILGGMPRYYDSIDRADLKFSLNDVIKFFIDKSYPGWKEVRGELIEEFRDAHPTYFSILEAIASGNVTAHEISSVSGIQMKSIYKYLSELENFFGIIEKRIPIIGSAQRPARYYMKAFLRFLV